MPNFLPMQDWLRGMAATGTQIIVALAVLWLCYRLVRFTDKQPKQ